MPKEEDASFDTGSEPAPVDSDPNMQHGESFTDYFERMHREQQRTPILKLNAHKDYRSEAFRLVAEGHALLRPLVERRYGPLEVAKGKYREEPPKLKAEKHLDRKRNLSDIGAAPPTGLIGNDPTFRHSPKLAKRADGLGAIANGDTVAETTKENPAPMSRSNQHELNPRPRNNGRGIR